MPDRITIMKKEQYQLVSSAALYHPEGQPTDNVPMDYYCEKWLL